MVEDSPTEVHKASNTEALVGVLLVLCVAVFPNLYYAVCHYAGLDSSSSMASNEVFDFYNTEISHSFASVAIIVPVLYLIWKSPEPASFFGLTKVALFADFGWTLVLFFTSYCVMAFGWQLVDFDDPVWGNEFPPELWPAIPSGVLPFLMLLIANVLNALAEELTMRGILLPRLKQLTGSTVVAVLTSSFFFASYHLYGGVVATIDIFLFGVVFACFYLWIGRIWPLVLAHTLWNLALVYEIMV